LGGGGIQFAVIIGEKIVRPLAVLWRKSKRTYTDGRVLFIAGVNLGEPSEMSPLWIKREGKKAGYMLQGAYGGIHPPINKNKEKRRNGAGALKPQRKKSCLKFNVVSNWAKARGKKKTTNAGRGRPIKKLWPQSQDS